jgi:hypothetical protein
VNSSGKCAFLTLEDPKGYHIYDHLLVAPLATRGWSVEMIPWTRAGEDWRAYDAVIIRSTWDYQRSPQTFLSTLEEIEQSTRLFNPVEICRWNLHKSYLRELEARAATIVPTLWEEGLNQATITRALESFGVKRLVVKPPVGAGAEDTFVLEAGRQDSFVPALKSFAERDVMVQPFIDSIQGEGEYSLFYFGGELSHAIVKRPATGDFRVQEEHGGLIAAIDPPADCLLVGQRAIEAIGTTLLYARVDLVRLASGQMALIELELIEPSLYFEQSLEATERFADAFLRMMAS